MEGSHRGPMRQGHAQGVGCALGPRGQVLAPPAVFSVPDILKYSRKKSYLNFRAFGELLFRGIFHCMDNSENWQENTIFALFNLNNRK